VSWKPVSLARHSAESQISNLVVEEQALEDELRGSWRTSAPKAGWPPGRHDLAQARRAPMRRGRHGSRSQEPKSLILRAVAVFIGKTRAISAGWGLGNTPRAAPCRLCGRVDVSAGGGASKPQAKRKGGPAACCQGRGRGTAPVMRSRVRPWQRRHRPPADEGTRPSASPCSLLSAGPNA